MFDEFEALDTTVVAIAQEDETLEQFGRMVETLQPGPRFDVVADLNREKTHPYDRTTAYLIDKEGIVREIFPMIIHARPSWTIVQKEVERLAAEQAR